MRFGLWLVGASNCTLSLQPDNVRLDLIAARPLGRPAIVLQTFLDSLTAAQSTDSPRANAPSEPCVVAARNRSWLHSLAELRYSHAAIKTSFPFRFR